MSSNDSTEILDCVLAKLVTVTDLVSEQLARSKVRDDDDLASNLTVILEHLWTIRWEANLLPEGYEMDDPTRAKAIVVPCTGGVVVVTPPAQQVEAEQ